MTTPVAVILAAGKGTRMKSDLPKVLHPVCGQPMLKRVIDAVHGAGISRIVVIVGHRADLVRDALSDQPDVEFALQEKQLGTGHAMQMGEQNLAGHDGPVLVLAGDVPLLQSASLTSLLEEQRSQQAACVIATAVTEANQGLGRIVRDDSAAFDRIVEEKDATPAEREIQEINTGCYVFDGSLLFDALRKIGTDNAQGEVYLTDAPAILKAGGHTVLASPCMDIVEAMGVNTVDQLAEVDRLFAQRNSQ